MFGWMGDVWMDGGCLDGWGMFGWMRDVWMDEGCLDGWGMFGWMGDVWMDEGCLDGWERDEGCLDGWGMFGWMGDVWMDGGGWACIILHRSLFLCISSYCVLLYIHCFVFIVLYTKRNLFVVLRGGRSFCYLGRPCSPIG